MQLLLIHYVATLVMTGAIWLAQLSQYPLLAFVGRRNFIRYEREHVHRISAIAWTVMGVELATGILLIPYAPTSIPLGARWWGVFLLGIIWVNTLLVQYPIHKRLARGFDASLLKKLVQTNWIRTLAWTVRAVLWTSVIYGYYH